MFRLHFLHKTFLLIWIWANPWTFQVAEESGRSRSDQRQKSLLYKAYKIESFSQIPTACVFKTTSIVIMTSKSHKMISSTSPLAGGQILQKTFTSQPGLFYTCTRARRAAGPALAAGPLHPTGSTCQQLLGSCTLCLLYQPRTLPSGPGNASRSCPKSPMPLSCLRSSGHAAEDLLLWGNAFVFF